MKKENAIKILAGLAIFVAGLGIGGLIFQPKEEAPKVEDMLVNAKYASGVQIRVNDGNVEWYDGIRWHVEGSVEELAGKDTFHRSAEDWETMDEQLSGYVTEDSQTLLASLNPEDAKPLIGENEQSGQGTQGQTSRPQNAASQAPAQTSQRPAQTQQPAVQTPAVGGASGNQTPNAGSSNDDSSDDDSSDNSAPGDDSSGGDVSGGESSGGQDTPVEEPPAEDPPADDTGDGENMDWSNDYL
ncbi:MAG: hypothetical protein NC079_04365 [Clostridium sp.]|nr:hypothetical protein [Acetatifactor muris]MCM1526713.1 hypothetical protein [Bacteroides sp.]MCM1562827.1 hypothetical protein [Clostridium sp.]